MSNVLLKSTYVACAYAYVASENQVIIFRTLCAVHLVALAQNSNLHNILSAADVRRRSMIRAPNSVHVLQERLGKETVIETCYSFWQIGITILFTGHKKFVLYSGKRTGSPVAFSVLCRTYATCWPTLIKLKQNRNVVSLLCFYRVVLV